MSIHAGDILLLNYPFADTSGSKLRPAVVVSADRFNRSDDLVLVPISSVEPSEPRYALAIRESDPGFRTSGLRTSSYLRWTKPTTLSRRVFERRLGTLPKQFLAEVQTRLRTLFEQPNQTGRPE